MSLFTCTFLSGYACANLFGERVWQELRQMPTIQLRVPNKVELPPIFACRRNQILGEDFDGTNQIKTDWDVTSLCWTW